MKKIIVTALALLATLCMNAQTIKVYEYNSEGNLSSTPAYTSTNKVKVVFEDANNSYKYQNLKAGDKVEGTVTVNGITYTKAVGGTVADYVDLGMKNADGKSIIWATHNLGASTPEDYGAYIAWGENGTEEEGYKDGIKTAGYTWSNLMYCNNSSSFYKYVATNEYGDVDYIYTLECCDDAATVNWGKDWRTPTWDEVNALVNNLNLTWTKNGNGWTVTSKISGYEGNSIYLPDTSHKGDYTGTTINGVPYYNAGFWSSSLFLTPMSYSGNCTNKAGVVTFMSGCRGGGVTYRNLGFPIRPVRVVE